MPSLLEVSADEARRYFMEPANYVNFDLPQYFVFDELLSKTAAHIGNRGIHEFFATETTAGRTSKINPKDIEGVNYRVISNKDGEFAWRPFEIIHPALYIALINELTAPTNWAYIRDRFGVFATSAINCESIPFVSEDLEKHKAHQIKRWWENVEQAGLRLSLRFNCVYDVDIADCYGSIYTHSIAWALHNKAVMKQGDNRVSDKFIGNRLDWLLQKMRHGQTNGIPQGSTAMDFIAEILLGYIDMLLSQKLDDGGLNREDYAIIRYRDDYKIFTNNSEMGRKIVRELSGVLTEHGLKLNTAKTKMQLDPVIASVKPDKIYELFVPNNKMTLSKRLMQIYRCAELYPNSGVVTRLLNDYYRHIRKVKKPAPYDDPEVMIGIVTNLALRNPKSYSWSMAILSHLLDFCPADMRLGIVDDIRRKFEVVPNTGILDIWLQRITFKLDPTLPFTEKLARIAAGDYHSNVIWKSSWLVEDLRTIIATTSIIDKPVIDEMPSLIMPQEVALFTFPDY